MPAIKKDEKQQKALVEISESLAAIRALNSILVTGWSGNIIINFDTGESGRNKFVRLTLDAKKNERDWAAALKMASQQKTRLVRDIKNKAAKFAIGLDKSDHLIMGPADKAVREDRAAAVESEDDAGLGEEMDLSEEEQAAADLPPGDDDDIDPYGDEENPDPESL